MNGKIKWFNYEKGYGYITGEDGNDYFVHCTNIGNECRHVAGFNKDDEVTFVPGSNAKGNIASCVNLTADPRTSGKKMAISESSELERLNKIFNNSNNSNDSTTDTDNTDDAE